MVFFVFYWSFEMHRERVSEREGGGRETEEKGKVHCKTNLLEISFHDSLFLHAYLLIYAHIIYTSKSLFFHKARCTSLEQYAKKAHKRAIYIGSNCILCFKALESLFLLYRHHRSVVVLCAGLVGMGMLIQMLYANAM